MKPAEFPKGSWMMEVPDAEAFPDKAGIFVVCREQAIGLGLVLDLKASGTASWEAGNTYSRFLPTVRRLIFYSIRRKMKPRRPYKMNNQKTNYLEKPKYVFNPVEEDVEEAPPTPKIPKPRKSKYQAK
jgi:hypothetical protein